MLGRLGLRIFEATSADIADLGEEHGHRVLRVCGKGTKIVLVPLPPAVGRAIDRAAGLRDRGPILLNTRGTRMDRHAATRRLRQLAHAAGTRPPGHTPACSATPTLSVPKGAELHRMHHSAVRVNTRCLQRSVRPCGALGPPGRRAAAATWDFTVRLDLMQRGCS
jgi:integrase